MPFGSSAIAAGLYVAKPPATSYAGINLVNSTASYPLLNCLSYYSQISVYPSKSMSISNKIEIKKIGLELKSFIH
jgi:hypothetical protein